MERSGSAGVGKSVLRDGFAAGAQAGSRALATARHPGLALVFGTAGYEPQALLDGVRSVLGEVPLSGCSAEGVITRDGADEQSHAVVVVALEVPGATFRTYQVQHASRDPRAAGRALIDRIGPHAAAGGLLMVFPDGVTTDGTALLDDLQRELPPGVQVVGGLAGTELGSFSGWVTSQYHDGRAASDAVSAVLVTGGVEAEIAVSHGCKPLGVTFEVTRSDGAVVSELDGRPAFEALREYLDGDAVDLSANDDLHLVVGIPIEAAHRGGYGDLLVRAPIRLLEGGALFFNGGGVEQGIEVELARRDLEGMRESAASAAAQLAARRPGERPLLVLQFDCTGRGRVACGERTTELTVEPLRRVLGEDVPWAGFHTFGEIAPLGGAVRTHACTVAVCALYAPRAARS